MQILKLFFNIMLFRQSPADVPYNQVLLAQLLACTLLGFILLSLLLGQSLPINTGLEIASLSITALALYIILHFMKLKARFVQTLTAVLGVNLLFLGLILLVALFTQDIMRYALIAQPIYLWSLAVMAYILRNALETSWLKAILFVLIIEVSRFIILSEAIRSLT